MNRGRHCTYHASEVRYAMIQILRNCPLRFSPIQIAQILNINWTEVQYHLYDVRNKARHRCAGK
jgi:hypothetical protein